MLPLACVSRVEIHQLRSHGGQILVVGAGKYMSHLDQPGKAVAHGLPLIIRGKATAQSGGLLPSPSMPAICADGIRRGILDAASGERLPTQQAGGAVPTLLWKAAQAMWTIATDRQRDKIHRAVGRQCLAHLTLLTR